MRKVPQTELPEEELPKDEPPVRPQRRQSVAIYLIILFAAAFLLLLMAYFMQQRNSDLIIGNLQDSLTSFQTVEELREQNEQLQGRLLELEEDLEVIQAELDNQKEQQTLSQQKQEQAQVQVQLLTALYVAEYLYNAGDPAGAARRLADISAADQMLLSEQSDSGAPSEARRYADLRDALIQSGHLVQDGDGQLTAIH